MSGRANAYTERAKAQAMPRALAMQARRREGWTLQQIADEHGLSRQRVHVILKRLETGAGASR